MPYIGSVTLEYPINWVNAYRFTIGGNYMSVTGNTVVQRVSDNGIVGREMELHLDWVSHDQVETLFNYYLSTNTYQMQMSVSGGYYDIVFSTGQEAFDLTPIVPEVPYSYRSLSSVALTGSYYSGSIRVICIGVTGG